MDPTNTDQTAPISFKDFFKWCQQHLKERGWGRLDEAAARYLRTWGLASTSNTTDTGRAIKRLLDAVPHARISKGRLDDAALQGDDAGEIEWVLPSEVDLHGRPTYQMRSIQSHTRVNGRTLFLNLLGARTANSAPQSPAVSSVALVASPEPQTSSSAAQTPSVAPQTPTARGAPQIPIDTVSASQGADAIGGMWQINTSLQLSQTTLNVLFDSPGDSEVGLPQAAVPRVFGLTTDDLEVDASQ
ncbi:unnamed protein product [Phytophthora fragariaefolia]|uniref:Unnamed protein product n=1 Tax=Phytophthora fragariaefolia TaxID=1490495 RepID=A0A9W6XKI7_9STRA|nr:unnamed protein product [Phytophthora fragariaefolia]